MRDGVHRAAALAERMLTPNVGLGATRAMSRERARRQFSAESGHSGQHSVLARSTQSGHSPFLMDHLCGAYQKRLRGREAKHLCRFALMIRLLDRQVTGLLAA